MNFVESYNAQTSWLIEDYPLAKTLLEGNAGQPSQLIQGYPRVREVVSHLSPVEIRRKMMWAKLNALNLFFLKEKVDEYLALPREKAFERIGKSLPYINAQGVYKFLQTGDSSGMSYNDSIIYNALVSRYNYERDEGLLPPLPDFYVRQFGVKFDINSNPKSKKYRDAYVYAFAMALDKTLDDLWVLSNSYVITANGKYLEERYTEKMHGLDMAKLDRMGDICLELQDKEGYSSVIITLERCPDESLLVATGHNDESPFKYKKSYSISLSLGNSVNLIEVGETAKLIGNSNKVYFSKSLLEAWANFDRVNLGSAKMPPYFPVTCTAKDRPNVVDYLCGVTLNDLAQLSAGREIKALFSILFECIHQYGLVIEREVEVDESKGAMTGQSAKPKTSSSKHRSEGVSFRSLIKYVYKGEHTHKSSGLGTHASPCEHTRRAHTRTLKSGKVIHIGETVVNKGGRKAEYKMSAPIV